MDLIVLDDSKRPAEAVFRPGMGSLVAVGGMYVPSAEVNPLTLALEELCEELGFPPSEEFKWSPHRRSWMRENVRGGTQEELYVECLKLAAAHEVQAWVMVEDIDYRSTTGSDNHELDVVKLFLERCQGQLEETDTEAILLADHPSGGRPAEAEFTAACLRTLRDGTRFVRPTRVALVVTEDSQNTRLLQLADLIVGCTLAFVAGENKRSPALFEKHIRALLRRSEKGRIGGFGLKIYPDRVYRNLYHWLLEDELNAPRGPYVNDPLDPGRTKVKRLPLMRPVGSRPESRPGTWG